VQISAITPWAVAEPGGRRYVILKIATDEGLAGYGEAPAAPDPQSAVERLKRELAMLRGLNPARTLQIDIALAKAGASPEARGAANIALMDLLGKTAKAPLYEALGGPTRTKARAMAVVAGGSTGEIRDAVMQAKAQGHRAFSIPLRMPAGMERGRSFYVQVRQMLDDLRAAAGEACDFVLDCGGQPTPGEALSIADRVEDFHLLWMDEPCNEVSAAARASISAVTVTPMGFGRNATRNSEFQNLLRENAIDVLRPDLTRNGVTNAKKAAAIGETYYVALCPFNRGGPIATAAGIHLAAALPNSFIQETPFSFDETDRRMRRDIAGGWDESPEEGWFKLLDGHGLGLAVDEAAIQKYVVAS
jgi:galactonate dehydratase